MRENPPIMVLSEETPESVTFRFKGTRWAVATFIPGVVLLGLVTRLYLSAHSPSRLLVIVGMFGALLVYSSLYSLTADQWLVASGSRKTLKFHKKNLYGLVEWERPPQDFQGITVGRHLRSSNWQITLVCRDGLELYLGEHALGAFTLERALNLARKVSDRTGIMVKSPNPTP